MINTYHLFSIPVTHGKFVVPVDIYKKIIKYAEENYVDENYRSCQNGFQSHDNFDGKEELNKELNIYLNNNLKLDIEYSWLNVLGKNSYNSPHKHPGTNTKCAGVLYLSSENNNITFTSNGDTYEIKPKLFDYLIFPHDLVHYVLSEERDTKRISYSFNMTILR